LKTTSKNNATIPDAGTWDYIEFKADSPEDIVQFRATRASGTDLNVGEVVVLPISNSKNFPLDVVHQVINIQHIFDSL